MGFGHKIWKKLSGKPSATATNTDHILWSHIPYVPKTIRGHKPDDVKFFQNQLMDITNFILLEDVPLQPTTTEAAPGTTTLKWINNGELISGSTMTRLCDYEIKAQDVDIYVHSELDARKLVKLNNMMILSPESSFCMNANFNGIRINLIWGIVFNDARDLVSGFDIRACAIAFDPNKELITAVDGAYSDATSKTIVFQTTARLVSVFRLLKYLEKGFTVSRYQRVVFTELIKAGKHDPNIELITGGYA